MSYSAFQKRYKAFFLAYCDKTRQGGKKCFKNSYFAGRSHANIHNKRSKKDGLLYDFFRGHDIFRTDQKTTYKYWNFDLFVCNQIDQKI